MVARPGRAALLRLHMMTAVVDAEGNIGEYFPDVIRSNPILRLIGMIVVNVHGNAVCFQKIDSGSVAVLIPGADIIPPYSQLQRIRVRHPDFVGVFTVARLAHAGGLKYSKTRESVLRIQCRSPPDSLR